MLLEVVHTSPNNLYSSLKCEVGFKLRLITKQLNERQVNEHQREESRDVGVKELAKVCKAFERGFSAEHWSVIRSKKSFHGEYRFAIIFAYIQQQLTSWHIINCPDLFVISC